MIPWWAAAGLLIIGFYVIERAIETATRILKAEAYEIQSTLREILNELQSRK